MIGFDNEKYLRMQSEHIHERIAQFGGKLYLEFGGKLFDDFHASRVLPGFQPDSKLQMLLSMKESAEIVVVISSPSIESDKRRGDIGITYAEDVLRLIDAYRAAGLYVGSIVITRFNGQKKVLAFEKKLRKLGLKTYRHYDIPNYPYDVDKIVSDEGLGKNDYVETSRPLIVITAPGPGAGKFATCLSQLYQDSKRGIKSGYAKFETFPIWNLPLKHPVNLAYEAATADLDDVNMIDPFHLEAYGKITVNYNRDIESFPVLNRLFERLYGASPYKSPTDMGVNMAGNCIRNDEACQEAARQEIIRRYLKGLYDYPFEKCTDAALAKLTALMKNNNISVSERKCVDVCLEKAKKTGTPVVALELEDGSIITGKTTPLLMATSAMILNALKKLAGISDKIDLLPKGIIEPICDMKTKSLRNHNPRLHLDEILIALSISAITNPLAELALAQLPRIRGCQAHSSVILSDATSRNLKKLGIEMSQEPIYETKSLYHSK